MKTTIAFLLIISAFIYWALDKYRYYDFHTAGCSSSIEVELIGSFSMDHPVNRGAPYYARLAFNESDSSINPGKASASFVFTPISNTGSQIKIEAISNIFLINNKKVLVFESINIPYEDYQLSISIDQNTADKKFECTINRSYSEEFRFRLWDILLSV